MANYTHLSSGSAAFSKMMLNNGFGIVTVMNARIYDFSAVESKFSKATGFAGLQLDKDGKIDGTIKPICRLDTLKVANVTVEGPTKTVTGGQNANPLIKFGKTARLEMQDALGNSRAIEALCGGLNEWSVPNASDASVSEHFTSHTEDTTTTYQLKDGAFPEHIDGKSELVALHYGPDFTGAKTIVGDTYFIDKETGKQVKVQIVFYQFLPDSIFNLTQDAEGDATVFDMNGDLAMTTVKINDNEGKPLDHDLFYSVFAEQPVYTPTQE